MIPVAEPYIGKGETDNVIKAMKSGWISSKGDFILEFEEKFAKYCGVRYGVATSNGTVALHLALKALDIKSGDEVIVPTLSFIATANAVTYCNTKPIFVDSHPDYWCINPEKIEEKITKNTKAIIPVHLYGHPCDMGAIMDIAEDNNLYVIEDAAEAHGAEYRGRKTGSFGNISCFSFYGNKIITTGEGGMCLTNDEELADKMRILRGHGMNPNKKYWHDVIGFNYRMTNVQAAIGVAQLEKISEMVETKRENAMLYNSLLKEIDGIGLPPEAKWVKNVYWMYSILVNDKFGMSRDELIVKLGEAGIDTRSFFYPIHIQPPYKDHTGKFPVAEELSRKGVNLPSSVTLKRGNIEYIASKIKEFAGR